MAEEKGKEEKTAPARKSAGMAAADKLREAVEILEASSGMRAKSHAGLAAELRAKIGWLEEIEPR